MVKQSANQNILHYADLRAYFKAVFDELKSRKPHFTQSAFSKHLGCSASTWSNFTEGRRDLSSKKIIEIGKRLKWSTAETSHALNLRSLQHSDAATIQSIAAAATSNALSSNRDLKKANLLETDLNLISVILMECVRIPEFSSNPIRAVESLGFTPELIQRNLDELLKQGVLRKTGEGFYEKTGAAMLIVAEKQSDVLRNFHRQMISAAMTRIRAENTEKRYLGSETFAFNPELLPDAKKIVNQCLDDLASLSYRCKNPTTVYHAGVQIFELLEKLA